MQKVERPKADLKKISFRENFEDCYIRHQYFRRAGFNPSEKEMLPYAGIMSQQARNTYFTYRNLFSSVGMECDDIINVARVHLTSYLGIFALNEATEKFDQFIDKHWDKYSKIPAKEDFLNKNKADFTVFLQQRMEDLVRVCRQKVRNIRGYPSDDTFVYVGSQKPPMNQSLLIRDYEKYGFRKLDIAVFKTIRKRANAKKEPAFEFNGMWYISVDLPQENLKLEDLSGAGLDPYDSIHHMGPERLYFEQEEDSFWQSKRREFESYRPYKRARVLKKFVDNNKNKIELKEEVKLARKLLKEIGA